MCSGMEEEEISLVEEVKCNGMVEGEISRVVEAMCNGMVVVVMCSGRVRVET